ncbi:MAG: type II secretion system protein M [Phycisphaerales bacterium]|nr:type II secretion system protein M [Phycisphaerales bacterium]
MSTANHGRQMLAEFAIGVLACAGVYMMLVDPAQRELAKTRAEIDTLRAREAEQGSVSSLTEEQVAELRRVTASRAETVRERSRLARDEAAMFGAIMSMASEHGVRIEQLQPGAAGVVNEQGKLVPAGQAAPAAPPASTGSGPGSQAAPAPAVAPARDMKSGYTIFATGTYASVAALLESLQSRLGYTTIRSVRLTSQDSAGPEGVSVQIETEHLAIDLSGVKIPAAGGGAAKPNATTQVPTP